MKSFVCLISLWWLFSAPAAANDALAVPIKVAAVDFQPVSQNIYSSGLLKRKAEHKLSFKIPGLVASYAVEEGQWVKRGAILASLDLAEINAQLAEARSRFENAKRQLRRLEALHQRQVVPLEQMQDARTRVQVTRSQLQVVEFNLKHSVIRAPVDGRILKRSLEVNEQMASGQTAFVLAASDKGWVIRLGVTDKQRLMLQLDDPAAISFDAYPGVTFEGRVAELAAAADDVKGTFEVELALAPGKLPLLSGMVSRIVLTPSQTRNVALINLNAVVAAEQSRVQVYVFEPEAEQVALRELQLAWLDQEHIAVSDGLRAGELVVVEGAPYLQPGRPVTLVESQTH